jgi:hypothetical protein
MRAARIACVAGMVAALGPAPARAQEQPVARPLHLEVAVRLGAARPLGHLADPVPAGTTDPNPTRAMPPGLILPLGLQVGAGLRDRWFVGAAGD